MDRLTNDRAIPSLRSVLINRFRSPHLNRLIAINRIDRESLIALADQHNFPTELIDEMCDFLENKLLQIIVKNGKNKIIIPVKPIEVNSTDELKQVIRKYPRETMLKFTDEFYFEYFERVRAGGMSEAQLDFYERALK